MRTPILWHELGALALGGALLILPACEPKADDSSGGSSSAGDSEGSSTGEDSLSGSGSSASGTGNSSTSDGTSGGSSDSSSGVTSDATTGQTSLTTQPTSDSNGVTSDATTGDPPQPCAGDPAAIDGLVTSMAYLKSQIPPDMTSGGSSGSSSGGEPDPSTLYIRLSDQSFECKDPNAILTCGPHWDVTIVIPPEYQTPGTYALGPGDVLGVFGETGPDEGGNMCGFGGGTFGATLELIALDDSTVEGRLCNVDSPWLWPDPKPDLEGTFYADRCP